MPMIDMNVFMQHIRAANASFTQKRSHLDGIIQLLGGTGGAANRDIPILTAKYIEEIVVAIPTDRLKKYRAALQYLGTQLNIDSYARPVNPRMTFEEFKIDTVSFKGASGAFVNQDNGSYIHVHKLEFDSSNNDPSVFSDCLSRERIWYPVEAPDDVPFSILMHKVPRDFFQPVGGSTGNCCFDDHSTMSPGLIVRWPLQQGRVQIRQHYQYKVPNGQWKTIRGGEFILEKGVRVGRSGNLVFYFFKKNWAPFNTRNFHFEVEYEIGAQPADLPQALPKTWHSARRAVLHEHATIISAG